MTTTTHDLRQALLDRLDGRDGRIEARGRFRSRGYLIRRLLIAADLVGLAIAFLASELIVGGRGAPDTIKIGGEIALFGAALPIWVFGAKLFGLYDRDEERAHYSTTDDLVRVFLLATVGIFLITRILLLSGHAHPDLTKLTVFWGLIVVCIPSMRMGARIVARKHPCYIQNTVIVGADEVGQLVARKMLLHREYGIRFLGFVSSGQEDLRSDLGDQKVVGSIEDLERIVSRLGVDRVVFAFPDEPCEKLVHYVRALRDAGVQVDIVPRLYETIGPKHNVHSIEGIPLVGLAPISIPRSSQMIKRSIDVAGAAVGLFVTAPVFAAAAVLIKLGSKGPVFFRQTRLGQNMREFTLIKFRTMKTDVDESEHRDYIAATMSSNAPLGSNGVYKLERSDAITRAGRWLRRTSLDELPQLINVLRGEMSLVGPRPCLSYEVEHFAPHHFDRFLVPAGMTGLWQVSARANSTFGEALDLDVLYAHSWSLALDLSLLVRTPLQVFRAEATR